MAETMTTGDMAEALGFAQSTVRQWCNNRGIKPQPYDQLSSPSRWDTLQKKFDNDLEAITAFISGRTIRDFMGDLGITYDAALSLERKYGTRAKRICAHCEGEVEFSGMETNRGGRPKSVCKGCAAKPKNKSSHCARIIEEQGMGTMGCLWMRKAMGKPHGGTGWYNVSGIENLRDGAGNGI
jgi:plasmid maintenance system antidote protein VapI